MKSSKANAQESHPKIKGDDPLRGRVLKAALLTLNIRRGRKGAGTGPGTGAAEQHMLGGSQGPLSHSL